MAWNCVGEVPRMVNALEATSGGRGEDTEVPAEGRSSGEAEVPACPVSRWGAGQEEERPEVGHTGPPNAGAVIQEESGLSSGFSGPGSVLSAW